MKLHGLVMSLRKAAALQPEVDFPSLNFKKLSIGLGPIHLEGTNERLEVAAVSWNLVCNLVAVCWLYEGIVKPCDIPWFEMSSDSCEVHDENYRRGPTG